MGGEEPTGYLLLLFPHSSFQILDEQQPEFYLKL
jgi:hypothetical protein